MAIVFPIWNRTVYVRAFFNGVFTFTHARARTHTPGTRLNRCMYVDNHSELASDWRSIARRGTTILTIGFGADQERNAFEPFNVGAWYVPRTAVVPLTIGVQGVQLHSAFGVGHCVEHGSTTIIAGVQRTNARAGRADPTDATGGNSGGRRLRLGRM